MTSIMIRILLLSIIVLHFGFSNQENVTEEVLIINENSDLEQGFVSATRNRGRKVHGVQRGNNTAYQATNKIDRKPNHDIFNNDELQNQVIQLLQRLNDRFTMLQALDEQQLRRMETLEYRLTKLEVQMQEKFDVLKGEMREMTRRVQQLDWQSSKEETVIESIKLDILTLKEGQEQLRNLLSDSKNRALISAESKLETQVGTIVTSMYTMMGVVKSFQDTFSDIGANFTTLTNVTRSIAGMSNKLVTKQDLRSSFLENNKYCCQTSPLQNTGIVQLDSKDNDVLLANCKEILDAGHNISGIYRIKPHLSSTAFFVYCDMYTKGGGWIVIQNRFEGSLDFYKGWLDYKLGFGNLADEFWVGLEKLHVLTNYQVNELLIELEDFSQVVTSAKYSAFAVGSELEGYPLSLLGDYEGDAGDSLIYHAGMKFSTYDMDHDNWLDGNCAESHTGAWWYNGCDTSNLNGRYLGGEQQPSHEYQGMYWYDWHGPEYSLMRTRMSIRPKSQQSDTSSNSNIRSRNDRKNKTSKKRIPDKKIDLSAEQKK